MKTTENKLILFGNELFPSVRCIQFLLNYLKIEYEYIYVKTEDFKLPILKVKNNKYVKQLADILMYLSNNYDKSLFPSDEKNTILNYFLRENTRLESVYNKLFFEIINESFAITENDNDDLLKVFNDIECVLLQNNFLCFNKLTICDFSCVCLVKSCMFFIPHSCVKKYKNIMDWLNRIRCINSYKETVEITNFTCENYLTYLLIKNKTNRRIKDRVFK